MTTSIIKYKIIIEIKTIEDVLLENRMAYRAPFTAPLFAAEYTPINPKKRIIKSPYRRKKHLIEDLTFYIP